jgi:two-component system response regulator YesN
MVKLYSLIIVDDEPAILKGLVGTYDWESMGYEVIGSARSGEEALRLAIELKPTVILADIRMKDMDGLTLVRRVKKEGLDIRFVLMSAYRDFEYAKTACDLGVFSYLTKVFTEEEITQVMTSLYEVTVSTERDSRHLAFIRENVSAITFDILRRFLLQKIETSNAAEELAAAGAKFGEDALYCCLCVDIPSWMDGLTSVARYNALSCFCDSMANCFDIVPVDFQGGIQALIIRVNENDADFEFTLQREVSSIMCKMKKFNYHIVCSVGREGEDLDGIKNSFREAVAGLKKTRYGLEIMYPENFGMAPNCEARPVNPDILKYDENTGYIKQAIKMIEAEIENGDITINGVAGRLHLNPMYLGRLFKHKTGISFNQYLLTRRMELAKKLLVSRECNVTEVSCRVGFNNTSYFTAQFKKYTSMLPSEYKQYIQEGENA